MIVRGANGDEKWGRGGANRGDVIREAIGVNVLGIGGYSHDSAAALVCDGMLVAAVAEERLTRNKHQGGIPKEAVSFCLGQAGLTMADVDHVGAYMKPGLRVRRRLGYRTKQLHHGPHYAAAYMGYELLHNLRYVRGLKELVGTRPKLHYMEHHPAHAASAFLVGPFEEAALLSVDYVGEFASTWMGVGRGASISSIGEIGYPHSLGVFYSGITDYLGFLRASDEYKVMGLASYGEPEFIDRFREIVREAPEGYALDLSYFTCHYRPGSKYGYFSKKFVDLFGPPRKKDEPVVDRHAAVAASAQAVLEETVLRLAAKLYDQTGLKKLCMAGGVALNCAMNGRLLREGPFDEIYIQPAAGDDGIAVGAAFRLYHDHSGVERGFVMDHAYFGPEYGNPEIESALQRDGAAYRKFDAVEQEAATHLADGKIVGWFQGAMEFGPRALGARSILADPTRAEMKDRLNAEVKFREEFRPFAPSCLAERAPDYFEGCADSPFMLFVHSVRPERREEIPAVTHVDGTARVQTVTRDANPRYYKLIQVFERLRGVPVVLNTSFNVMGEPIVNTPEDALRCFRNTGMDVLVMGDFVVTKR